MTFQASQQIPITEQFWHEPITNSHLQEEILVLHRQVDAQVHGWQSIGRVAELSMWIAIALGMFNLGGLYYTWRANRQRGLERETVSTR